ncbi:cell division control 45 family protein [Modestobacter sp. KNN46-3]|nr:cell division control 45 family protein [Modestobacter sp. KNN46-3]
MTDGPEVLAPQLQETSSTYLVVGTGVPGRSGGSPSHWGPCSAW